MNITLHRSEVEPGAMLAGVVHGAGAPVTVRVVWETQGKGDSDRVQVAEQTVADGPSGATFELQLPLLPLTYDGHLLKIGWRVIATAGGAELSTPFVVRWPA